MIFLDCVPASVRKFYSEKRAAVSPGLSAGEVAAWNRFVADARMIDFYEGIVSFELGACFVLDTASSCASIDWKKIHLEKQNTLAILDRVVKHADALAAALYDLEDGTARASLGGDDAVEEALHVLISGKDEPGKFATAAQKVSSSDLFSMDLVTERATSGRQHNSFTAFWRALSASLALQNAARPLVVPAERQLTAKTVAALCACALGIDDIDEENVKKLRQRDNS